MGVVEPGGGPCTCGGRSGCHHCHGRAVVVPMAWDRARDVLCRRPDVEPAGVSFDLEMVSKRRIVIAMVRALEWAIVAASLLWVAWWV